jgi:hypothetical protein
MGNTSSKGHEEYDRESIKCRGFVEKYSFKRGTTKRLFFTLKENELSYSKDKDLPVTPTQASQTAAIDKTFKILYEDLEKRELSIECVNIRGEVVLWKLVFSNKENTAKWANKLRKAVRPKWEDPATRSCSICDKTFQLFRRQHHCRNCGKVMCTAHMKFISNLPDLGYRGKVKICTNCINRIGNIDGVQRAKSLTLKENERKSILQYNSVLMPNNGSVLNE